MRAITKLLTLFLAAGFFSGCNGLFFYPEREIYFIPSEIDLPYRDLYLNRTPKLHGWYVAALAPHKATIIFLHGNAENISTHFGAVYWLPREGYDVCLVDYRGYGRSDGEPSYEGIYEDAARIIDGCREAGRAPFAVFAQSLGAAVAPVALQRSGKPDAICALILDSGFDTFRGAARKALRRTYLSYLFAWPLSYLVSERYSAAQALSELTVPKLFLHGEGDWSVPVGESDDLFRISAGPKSYIRSPDTVGHTQSLQQKKIRERFLRWVETSCTSPKQPWV